ncbi:MAG: prepilin-type N-terminal cleavage/methylation domain-containing protein [Patescibacteria group bacterium]
MKINKAEFLKGFTLIELLVVIAIIGILATVVLTSLSQSQAKAYDSKITQQLNQFRTAAQIYFSSNSGYGDASSCGEGMFNNFDASNGSPGATIAAGVLPDFSDLTCNSTSRAYAVKATLYSDTEYWCVDNTGASEKLTGTPDPDSTICP